MRTMIRLVGSHALLGGLAGCDSAMIDSSLKPEVTGDGPKEPDGRGKAPGPGNVDLGEIRGGGPLETRPQEGPSGAPKPVTSPDGKAH